MLPNPKVCVVFNSGASGDFFTTLLHQQIVGDKYSVTLSGSGAVRNSPGLGFKVACQEFFESEFDPACFESVTDEPVVNSHYCHPELLELFPECKFYYIDDREYADLTTQAFVNKRLSLQGLSVLENLHRNRLRQVGAKKTVQLHDAAILKSMRRDWISNCLHWEALGLTRIDFSDIFEQAHCRKIVEDIVKSMFNDEVFTETYIQWESKNLELKRLIKTAP